MPGILVMGHMDTVHPIGTLEPLPFRREGNRLYGPGVYDMKGGNYIAIEAIRQLARAGIATAAGDVLLTCDEEIGSPSTRDLIEAEAARHEVVLVPEPAPPRWRRGHRPLRHRPLQPAHDGKPAMPARASADGRSAIREMCRQVVAIEAMTTEDVTFGSASSMAGSG